MTYQKGLVAQINPSGFEKIYFTFQQRERKKCHIFWPSLFEDFLLDPLEVFFLDPKEKDPENC